MHRNGVQNYAIMAACGYSFSYLPLLCDMREKILIACSVRSAQLPSAVYSLRKMCHVGEETRTKVRYSC